MQVQARHLVTSSSGLSDHALQLINLRLGTAKGTEPLLRKLTGSLVLAVSEQFDDTALVWGKSVFDMLASKGKAKWL